jgi:uncharacterized peroxidase-related enzyme
MIEFALHSLDTAPPSSRAMLADRSQGAARLPNMVRALAESPTALRAFEQLRAAFSQSGLSALEQQVVYLAAAQANACHYCTTQRGMFDDSASARAAADAIVNNQPIPDIKLQSLRRFVAAMTTQRGWVSEDTVAQFLEAGYERSHVLDVITGIALATLSSYTNHVAATPLDGWTPAQGLAG